jgi:hypothetical protein
MKKTIFILLLSVYACSFIKAQGGIDWIYRVDYIHPTDCPDSVICPSDVKVNLNKTAIPDSSYIWLKIGSNPGLYDIYSKKYAYDITLLQQDGVATDSIGNISISLGRYMVGENFFVDMEIIESIE